MDARSRVLAAMLWITVIGQASWFGGTLYQMLVIVPIWSASPPESVRQFFQGTDYNRTIFNFFGPPFMAARNLPLVLALLAGWHSKSHRHALLIAVCGLTFGVLFTLFYIYPINAVLFMQAGGTLDDESIRQLAGRWIFADRFRFAVGIVSFVAILWAFRQPVRGAALHTSMDDPSIPVSIESSSPLSRRL